MKSRGAIKNFLALHFLELQYIEDEENKSYSEIDDIVLV